MSTKQNIKERDEARARLREILKPGDTVYTVLRHVSASGMSRAIDVFHFSVKDGKIQKHWLSSSVAKAVGYAWDKKHDCLKVSGGGMDMGFDVVYNLSYALFRDMQPVEGRRDAGYTLNQEWL